MRILIALTLIALSTISAKAEDYFVQVWTTGKAPLLVDEGAEVGRIEVSLDGKFVACSQASVIKNWNSLELAPISMGFTVSGNKDKLKFESFGELKRLTKLETKITPITN